MTGEWWGWDINAGPEAVNNGDGTWTVSMDPGTADMRYLWVVDGVQENLVDNAAAGECSDDITAGIVDTDYANWANRILKLGTYTASNTYDACTGTTTGGGGGTTDATQYCATKIQHFINADPGSEIELSISRVDDNTVKVSGKSTNDKALDVFFIAGTKDAPTSKTEGADEGDGTFSLTMTWDNGAPDSTSFEILWSKVDFDGNWMLRMDDLPDIDTKSSCSNN